MTRKKIVFVGAGKMAEAIIARLEFPQNIVASDVAKKRLEYLKKKYKIKIAKNNLEAFRAGEIVILAIKPQDMAEMLEELRAESRELRGQKLIISIAAGISLKYLQKKLPGFAVVRAMPNNPCLVGVGITALAKGKAVGSKAFKKAKEVFRAVGEVVEVPEKWMDAVTGLSGSGPAFVYQTIEALTAGGASAGLPKALAAKLALQTVLGAAITLKETGKSPEELREMVTSPGGTTIEGLKVLEKMKFIPALVEAVKTAAEKSKKLSQ